MLVLAHLPVYTNSKAPQSPSTEGIFFKINFESSLFFWVTKFGEQKRITPLVLSF